ncbi:MAG: T9SS type A sorting domain-containing protein [Bacteroidota bacterium]
MRNKKLIKTFIKISIAIFFQFYFVLNSFSQTQIEIDTLDQFNFDNLNYINGLCYDGEYIWLTDNETDSLIAIDKNNGEIITGFPSPLQYDIYGLTFDGQEFWVSSQDSLHELSHQNGTLLRSIRLPYPIGNNSFISGLSWVDNNLYCTLYAGYSSKIIGIDVNDTVCIDTIPPHQTASPAGLTFMYNYFWTLGMNESKIKQINPDNGEYEGWFPHENFIDHFIGITQDNEYIYCSDGLNNIYKYGIEGFNNISTDFFNDSIYINIFPNPVDNELHISRNKRSAAEVGIYNASGILVYQKIIESDKCTVDFTGLPAGLYLLKINNEVQTIVKK